MSEVPLYGLPSSFPHVGKNGQPFPVENRATFSGGNEPGKVHPDPIPFPHLTHLQHGAFGQGSQVVGFHVLHTRETNRLEFYMKCVSI